MKVKGLNYQSSYLITSLSLDKDLSDFNREVIGNLNLYYDNHLDILSAECADKKIIMLGYCFDIRNGEKNQEKILLDLVNSNNLHEELDYINGRYIFILVTGENQYIYSDALQLKPLVYHAESKSFASHDTLLNHVLSKYNYKITRSSAYKNNSLDYTQYNEIKKYNPSLYTDFKSFEFIRFYPRTKLETKDVKEVFNEIKPYLDETIKYMRNIDRDIFVTVTGGIDSRVSASLTRDFSNEVEYLTYTKKREKLDTKLKKLVYRNDEAITSEMKNYLGWNHSIIDLDDFQPSKDETNVYLKKFNSKHAYSLINYYRDYKKYYKALHIKSTGFGMGKADFPSYLDNSKDTFEFYEKCIHGVPSSFKKASDYNDKLKAFFERNKMFEGHLMERHYYDIFHLESRMGNWHSSLTLETDPETDELIIFNSRKLIDLIMQPSIENRREYKLYKTIINHYWPVLLRFGINKRSVSNNDELYSKNTLEFEEINLIALNKVEFIKEKQNILIKPKTEGIRNFELYSFAVMSSKNEDKKVILRSFYKNKKAKDKIKVIVKQGITINTYDILDLTNGIELDITSDGTTVSVFYDYSYTRPSWVNAGRLSVELCD